MGKKNKVGKFFKKVGKAIVKYVGPSDKAPQKATRLQAEEKKKAMVDLFKRGEKARKEYDRFLRKRK